jgi:hypothetical protein
VLFIAHGRIWQEDTAQLTGYILILFLVGLTCAFHYIPVHPINSELNYLWILPIIFVVFCFSQIVFLEHLMDEDSEDSEEPEKFTNSVHLLNMGHTVIIVLVILYYAAQVHYTWYGDMSFTNTGGKLDQRLNFELAELSDTLSYTNPVGAPGKYLRST